MMLCICIVRRYWQRVLIWLLGCLLCLSGCAGRQLERAGVSGPVSWQVTDFRLVERDIQGTARDLYAFTLVLEETQGLDLTFTQVVSVLSHPHIPTVPQQTPVHWKLRPRGTFRQAFFFPWCTTAACKQSAAVVPWSYDVALLGTDERQRPVRVVIRTTLPNTLTATPTRPALTPDNLSGPVAFETVHGHILVRALVNQQEHLALVLDTGAAASFITPEIARRLGLQPTARTPKRTITVVGGKQLDVPVVTLQSLEVGHARREQMSVGVLASFPNAPLVDGILGADFLQPFTMTFDYASSRLWLLPQGTLPFLTSASTDARGGSKAIPLRLVNNLILVQVMLDRREPVLFLLDTGASHTMVTPATAQRLGLRPAANAPRRTFIRGDGQTHEVPFVPCPTLQLGEAVVENLLVGISDLLPQASVVGGLLGVDFLERFTVTLDRTTRQLWLAPPLTAKP
ncbi:MAG: aspartyl protease family protein [Candidatus Tectimicrobiota bacterium]